MEQEIKAQIDRAKELLDALRESCNQDLQSHTISDKTKNLTQEILVKMRSVFDQSMYKFFNEKITPNLTADKKDKAKVYFPIVLDKNSLKSTLGRGMMSDFEQNYPAVFNFLESVQPYADKYKWMEAFSNFANEKHIRLTPQKRVESKRLTISSGGASMSIGQGASISIGSGASISLGGRRITGGQKIDADSNIIYGDPNLDIKKEIWVSFTLADTNINSLWLCEIVITEGEKIISDFFKLFQ